MPSITDWLMVIITAVYVGATIFICVFNGKSAKASMKQVEDSIIQFEANRRLQAMPFLQLEIPRENTAPSFDIELNGDNEAVDFLYYTVKLKNIGNGTAVSIIYSWEDRESNIKIEPFPINAIMQGDSYCFQLLINYENNSVLTSKIMWKYMDLLGNSYEQMAILSVEHDFLSIENDTPRFLGVERYTICKGGES